jgi:peptidyl-dipeptidase A
LTLPADLARKMKLLRVSLTVAAPSDPKESEELTRILASMEGAYGKGKYCAGSKCYDLEDLTKIMASSRSVKELRESWLGWHAIAPPLRKPFARYVELANKGARELGFATGQCGAQYDMPPDASRRSGPALGRVRPLYLSLHAYVRSKLRGEVRRQRGPSPWSIPATCWAIVGAGWGTSIRWLP